MEFLCPEWFVHNPLHRVAWVWEFHNVHHSIVELDWIGACRCHWMEIVVYGELNDLRLVLIGFDGDMLFGLAVVATAIGHLNHRTLDPM